MFKGHFWLFLLFLIGCGWKDGERYYGAVFSEDGERVAVTFQKFQRKSGVTHTKRRQFQTRILLAEDEGAYRELSEFVEGNVVDLYYQRNAGYLLMGRTGDQSEPEAGNRTNWVAYDMYDLTTGVQTPVEDLTGITTLSCDGGMSAFQTPNLLRYIPNPEGTVLARFSLSIGCEAREYTVSFVEPTTLTQIGREYRVRDVADGGENQVPLGSPLDLAWSEDGFFAVLDWRNITRLDHLEAVLYDPNGTEPSTREMHFECASTPSLSHSRRPDGREVIVDSESGELGFYRYEQASGYGCAGF
ncbi:MAG: hypothetical protein ACPGQS_07575 [Bradymonadia bacterium]